MAIDLRQFITPSSINVDDGNLFSGNKIDEIGIKSALITCRENNIGSRKIMEKCCGNPDTLVPSMYEGIMEYRYWIDVKEELKKRKIR